MRTGLMKTGITVAIEVGMTPAGNFRTSARLLSVVVRIVRVVLAPHGAVVLLKPEPSI